MKVSAMVRRIFEAMITAPPVRLKGDIFAKPALSDEEEALRQRNSGLRRSIDSRFREIFRACDEIGADLDEQVYRSVDDVERRLRR